MTALSKTLCAVLLSCGFAGSALAATSMAPAGSTSGQNLKPNAQTPTAPSGQVGATPNAQAPTHLSQRLRNDLSKAGFTDITIMPSSFLVRAKDSQGNPVMMVINPDSMTEVTEHTTEHHEAPLAGAIKGEPNSKIPSPAPKQ